MDRSKNRFRDEFSFLFFSFFVSRRGIKFLGTFGSIQDGIRSVESRIQGQGSVSRVF